MKKSKFLAKVLVSAMALSIFIPSAMAVTPRYLGAHSFSIAKGSSNWTGKDSKMWVPSSIGEATLSISTDKDVTVALYKVKFGIDEQILNTTTFTNGSSEKVNISDVNSSYYANITRSQKDSVSGTIALRQ